MPLPRWMRRALGILALGGGATGVVIVLSNLLANPSFGAILVMLVFLALYAFGVWAGLLMLEDSSEALAPNMLYWLLQVPVVSTNAVGYVFFSGFHLTARALLPDGAAKVDFLIGSMFKFNAMQPQDNRYLGINLFALAVVLLLWRVARGRVAAPAASVAAS